MGWHCQTWNGFCWWMGCHAHIDVVCMFLVQWSWGSNEKLTFLQSHNLWVERNWLLLQARHSILNIVPLGGGKKHNIVNQMGLCVERALLQILSAELIASLGPMWELDPWNSGKWWLACQDPLFVKCCCLAFLVSNPGFGCADGCSLSEVTSTGPDKTDVFWHEQGQLQASAGVLN